MLKACFGVILTLFKDDEADKDDVDHEDVVTSRACPGVTIQGGNAQMSDGYAVPGVVPECNGPMRPTRRSTAMRLRNRGIRTRTQFWGTRQTGATLNLVGSTWLQPRKGNPNVP